MISRYIIFLVLFFNVIVEASLTQKQKIDFGIFAFRSEPVMHKRYDAIRTYLNNNLTDYEVKLHYLSMDKLYEALLKNELDIIFTTPAQYIKLRQNNSLASTFATLVREVDGKKLSNLGGVILTKATNSEINTLADIKAKIISTPGMHFFGGYSTQAYEFYKLGIDIKSSAKIIESGSHDKALQELLDDKVDVAFVRTGILEDYIKAKKIKIGDVKVINQQYKKGYPYIFSTDLYPEWPLVALPNVNDDFLRELSALLFSLTPENPILKDGSVAGFIPPKDYLGVEKVLRSLRLEPFDKVESFTLADIFKKYTYEVVILFIVFVIFGLFFILLSKKNNELKNSRNSFKKLAKDFQESELLKNNILETIPDLIWLKDKNGVYITCNRQFEKFFGATSKEIKGKTDYDFVDKDLADMFRAHDIQAIESDKALINEEWITYATDGNKALLETTKQKLLNSDGTIFGVLGISHDITIRHILSNELEDEKNRFSLAIDGAQDGLWDWNLLTNEVFLTERFETMLGYEVGDIPQTKDAWFGLIHPEDRKNTLKTVQEYLDKKGAGTYENTFRLKRKDNTWCWMLGRGKAKFDENGKPLRFVGFNTDISAQIEYQQKLDHIAKHDPLTQLPNRFLLSKLLTNSMIETKKSKNYLALLFIDLDGFKEVNDIYGHDVGDEVLLKVSSNMKRLIHKNNILSRIGGDEFVIITPKLKHYNDIVPLIKRVLADISTPIYINNKKISISASIGVSLYPQTQDIGNEVLMRQADQAMYEAKLAGKNQYKFFNIEASVEIQQQQLHIANLYHALRNNQFTLHYQPKVDMSTNKPIGYEALLRWIHPEDGIKYPDSFLPYVENESDFMVELGRWVFESAFSQLQSWNESGLDTTVSINVSPYEIQQKNFCVYLIDLLSKYPKIKTEMIELEILESAAFDNFTQTTKVLHKCQELGMNIAIDDFGTGYASLHYLKKFPMNILKIDKSFVIDLLSTSQNISIVESSIGLAHAFNAHVLAEGVESEEHGILLRQLGCERAQGYAIAKAMPGSDVIGWHNSYKGFESWAKAKPIDPNDKIILHVSIEHKNWIKSVEDYINNKTDKLPHMSTSQCFLGNWLIHESTDAHRKNPEFDSIVKLHDELHNFSEELLLLSEKNKQAGIKRLYEMRDTMLEKLKSFI